jgi:hypothetical protein
MRNFVAAAMVATMVTTSALAAADPSVLPPGKPAGVQHAQDMNDNTIWWLVGLGVVAAGIALVASGGNNNALVSGTVGTTSTTTTTAAGGGSSVSTTTSSK